MLGNITVPEGKYVSETTEGKIVLHKITSEETKKKIAEHQEKLKKWIEIANKDSRVQNLTNGKGIQYDEGIYHLTNHQYPTEVTRKKNGKVVPVGEPADTVILAFWAHGQLYEVKIDLNSETVKSVKKVDLSEAPKSVKEGSYKVKH